jgi:hypothetical protein
MKAVISGFALLTFLAASTLPIESYAQTSTSPTMAPDTGTTPSTTTKKSKSSKSHAKKKSKKSSTQASSAKQQHHSSNTSKSARHSAS